MNGVKDKIWFPARRPVRQIRRRPGRPRRVRAGRQRRDGNLDQLPRHQDLAQRRHVREGGGDRQAHRAVDVRPRAADLLGDARHRSRHRRASAAPTTRSCCGRCRRSASSPSSPRQGREQLRVSRRTVTHGSNARFLPRRPLHRDPRARHQLCAGLFSRRAAVHVDRAVAFRTAASPSPRSISTSSPTFWATPRSARWRLPMSSTPRARCWRAPRRGPRSARICRALPQVAAVSKPGGAAPASGTDSSGHAVLTTSSLGAETRLARVLRTADRAGADADPRPAGAHRAADRARPRGRDHRRHHDGAAHAGADHRAAAPARGGSAPASSATASR